MIKLKKIPIAISFALLTSFIPTPKADAYSDLSSALKKSTVVVLGPSGSGSGVVIGKRNDSYVMLTAKHVLGTQQDEHDVLLPDDTTSALKILKIFPKKDLAIATFKSNFEFNTLPINSLLPYPAPNTAESRLYKEQKLRSEFDTVKNVGRVTGFSLPTNAVKIRLFRVIDTSLVALIKDNLHGYNLLYQASTVPGMSGGAVVGFRDCTDDRYGFALTISASYNFPTLVGIHGRSEDYHGQGRSGISLGIPINGDLKKFLIDNSKKYGIPTGEDEIRSVVNNYYCFQNT